MYVCMYVCMYAYVNAAARKLKLSIFGINSLRAPKSHEQYRRTIIKLVIHFVPTNPTCSLIW